ncbi:oxygenase MpaB family protein [Streptomyces poonensis]|uniref:Secreted protein n=1 Tax=Streptomyces poonensis TaxID=68255 RepID=A0A918UVA6_9ACTN|nr:oxygenase MpaB family protein [Streptomyces poonensis]GGZ35317.1 secreted protein [Streptomyces poonensis]GLJ89579.1 secreted protein [Streptomyces poonensis]
MENLNRRRVLSLGVALGLVGVADTAKAWAWPAADSVAGTGTGTDPEYIWDDAADPLLASLLDNGQVPSVNTAMKGWVNNGDPLPSGLPADLVAHLRQVNRLPSWADPAKLRRAADFNRRRDTYLFMLYGLGSGIMSTVIPREARSVYWSAGGADMQDRAAKTFTFGYDLSQLRAFEPTGQFVVTANKTRLVHAAVRHLLPQSPRWRDGADQTIPISAADILVTFHSLGTYVRRRLLDWRVPFPAADQEAFLHSWQVALHLLGVPDEYIPQTWAAADAQSAQVLTPILAPTPEGIDLAEVLLGLTAQIDLGVTRGFLNEFVRYVLSDEVGDWLGLRRDYAAAALVRTAWPAYILFREGLSPIMPGTFYMVDQFVRALAMLFLNKGSSTTTTPITIPTGNRPAA